MKKRLVLKQREERKEMPLAALALPVEQKCSEFWETKTSKRTKSVWIYTKINKPKAVL